MSSTHTRVLIVSASVGAGHNQAANAIRAAWEGRFPQANIEFADFMAGSGLQFNHLLKEIYLKAITISPDIYDILYRWTQNARSTAKVQDLLSWAMQKSMACLIKQYRPTMVLCTHPFPCGGAAYLKRNHGLTIPIVGVVTDFSVHPFWIYREVDQYIVAAPELQAAMLRQGISSARVAATGIPIHPRFALQKSATVNLNRCDRKKPSLLIMGGGLGLGPLQDLLLLLNQIALPLRLTLVAGKNTVLYKDLQALAAQSPHDVHVLGYTQQVPEIMLATDLLITKPGALTISEALAVGLPILFFAPIGGQEMDNAQFIIDKGAAQWLGSPEPDWEVDGGMIVKQLTELLASSGELTRMGAAAKKLGRPEAALAAVDAIRRRFENRPNTFEIGQ